MTKLIKWKFFAFSFDYPSKDGLNFALKNGQKILSESVACSSCTSKTSWSVLFGLSNAIYLFFRLAEKRHFYPNPNVMWSVALCLKCSPMNDYNETPATAISIVIIPVYLGRRKSEPVHFINIA